jgi:hypothetical protein
MHLNHARDRYPALRDRESDVGPYYTIAITFQHDVERIPKGEVLNHRDVHCYSLAMRKSGCESEEEFELEAWPAHKGKMRIIEGINSLQISRVFAPFSRNIEVQISGSEPFDNKISCK